MDSKENNKKTKLNYKVNFQKPTNEAKPEETKPAEEKKNFTPKNRTKLSMQAKVGTALANSIPQAPAQAGIASNPNGWGKNQ